MVTEQAFSFDDLIMHFKSSEAALRALCDGKIAAITGEHGTLVVHSPATATYGDHGEHMTVGVTKVSLDYRLESANAAYCHMLGYSERELVGRHLEEITQPESIAENILLLSQLSEGTLNHCRLHKAFIHKNGRTLYGVLDASVMRDSYGRPTRYLCTVVDITELREAEVALRESEERYRLLADMTMEGILIHKNGVAIDLNDSLGRLFGYRREELLNQNLIDLVHEDDRATVRNNIGKDYASPYPIRMVTRDGELLVVEIESRYCHKYGDQWRVTAFRDMTERRRAEAALAREKDLTDAIFNSVPGMLYLYDDEGRLVRWNKRHESLTGYSATELPGMQLLDWYRGDKESQAAVLQGIAATQRTGFGEATARLQKKDGTTVPMYLTASRLSIDGKEYFTGLGVDISEQMRLEKEREVLQGRLSQAQKMESVGRLAGGVAHDFNNMLGVILGHAEIALDKIDPHHPLHNCLAEISAAAQRSADLTRQLLAFARKQTIAPKILDLNRKVAGMLQMLARLIGEDIDLVWSPGSELWPVKMDPSQIDQILVNLCVNARDAIQGVGKITIETGHAIFDARYCAARPGFLPGEYVLMAVSDDGCGMDEATMARLFEPFFTTKEMGKGTGLGLATVYGIVKQNNGFINIYSEPGQGTSCKVYLPRSMEVAELPEEMGQKSRVAAGSETILLVEDEPAIRGMCEKMLAGLGYTVLSAATPEEAIRLARDNRSSIDLLMTDVVMPLMHGPELVKRLHPLLDDFKTLYMSGYTANVIAHHNVLDADVNFIQKPFMLGELADKLRQILR